MYVAHDNEAGVLKHSAGWLSVSVALLVIGLVGCSAEPTPSTLSTHTPIPTEAPMPTVTPTPTATSIPIATPTAIATPIPTATLTPVPTAMPLPPRVVALEELQNLIGSYPENQLSQDTDHVYVQERTITLPLAGEMTLLVIRETPGASSAIDTIEASVRQTEDFMNVAFPFEIFPVFISDNTSSYFARIYERRPRAGFITISGADEHQLFVIAHEVAHTYWHTPLREWRKSPAINGVRLGPFEWIFEGAATFMQNLAENRLHESNLDPNRAGCGYFQTIEELDQIVFSDLDEDFRDKVFGCNYGMGMDMFNALYHRLGDEEFRRGFGNLYLKISNLEHEDQCTGVETGICYVRKAFVEEASPGFAESAGEVINQWYEEDGLRPPGWRAIRGVVLRADGTSGLSEGVWIGITAYEVGASNETARSDRFIWADQEGFDFKVYVPDGTYSLSVLSSTAGREMIYGWYDGEGVTLDRNKAIEIAVDGTDVDGVELRLQDLP